MNLHGKFDYNKVSIYLVGGFVRDSLIGVEANDKDYVVVGSSPEEMLSLGFKQVGADFPVFLHPETKEEYALARTERNTSDGYKGFTCQWEGVTLEEDLSRRDLTINSMAVDSSGNLIDPFNGREDILNKILRHTSEDFVEDPLRVLRVARFLSRFGEGWEIHQDTKSLMRNIYLDSLPPERVWMEMSKALNTTCPSKFFNTLRETNRSLFLMWDDLYDTPQRLDHHPEGDVGVHTSLVMEYAAQVWNDPEIVFACLCHDFGKPSCWDKYENAHGHEKEGIKYILDFCDELRVPNSYRDLATLVCEYHTKIHGCLGRGSNKGMRPKSIMSLFEATGALKKPERFVKILKACEADAKGRGKGEEQIQEYRDKSYHQRDYLLECLDSVLGFNSKSVSKKLLDGGKSGVKIGETIRQEKIKLIRGVYNKWLKY